MINFFRKFKHRCLLLKGWWPIVWNDYDWDYVFILIALRHKIQRTRDHINQHRLHTDWQKTIQEMDTAILYLNRLIEGNPDIKKGPLCECKNENNFMQFCDWCVLEGIKNKYEAENLAYKQCFEHIGKHIQKWWC